MNAEAEDRSAMRTSIRVALLVAAGWATYVSVDDAVGPTDPILFEHFVAGAASALADNAQAQGVIAPGSAAAPATSPFAPSVAHVSGFTALSLPLPQQTPQQITPVPQPVPQQLYIGPLVVPAEPNAGAVPKSKRLQSTISNEATRVVEQPENAIGLLGPVMRDSGRHARVTPPFLMCTVEIREHAVLVSHQTIGCTQSDDGERPSMLMEFGQEVPNEIPDRKSTRLNSSHIQKSRMPSSA